MKKLAMALAVAGAAVFAGASGVHATGYNGQDVTVTVNTSAPAAGSTFTITASNCTPGSTATFVFEGVSGDAAVGTDTTASAIATAPDTPGTYSGSVTCDGTQVSFSVTVPGVGSTLPETGSGSGSTTTLVVASILLMAGVGMFGVAQMRRRGDEDLISG